MDANAGSSPATPANFKLGLWQTGKCTCLLNSDHVGSYPTRPTKSFLPKISKTAVVYIRSRERPVPELFSGKSESAPIKQLPHKLL
jgi:hypothetical protein